MRTEKDFIAEMKEISERLMHLANNSSCARKFLGDAVLLADNHLMNAIERAEKK